MKKEYFVKIPNWIARSEFLSPYAKTLYVAIVSYKPSFPSYSRLCRDTGIKSKTTIRKCLNELVHFDLIKIRNGGYNTSNTYIVNDQPFNGILNQDMTPVSPINGMSSDHEMDSNKINIKISNKANEAPSVLLTEEPQAKPLEDDEVNKAFSQMLKEMH